MIEAVVAEVRSHRELDGIYFTSIQINHNTISAPHTDNDLVGTPSIAMGLGDCVGGRLRLDGAKQPLNIRDHAVVFNGRNNHPSGIFNGDRWSLVLFVHSSWVDTSPAMKAQLSGFGFPCPPSGPTAVAVPAAVVDSELSSPSGDEEVAVEVGVDEVLDPKPKETLEEAESREHRMTHLPKNPHCEVCSKAKVQGTPTRRTSSKPMVAEEAKPLPTKFGEQVTGEHFIKGCSGREDEGDPNFPCDTVAVVLYDRGTRFLAVYPKSAKDTANTVAAMQHFAGPRDKVQSFYCDNAPELVSAATSLKWRFGNRYHWHATD